MISSHIDNISRHRRDASGLERSLDLGVNEKRLPFHIRQGGIGESRRGHRQGRGECGVKECAKVIYYLYYIMYI